MSLLQISAQRRIVDNGPHIRMKNSSINLHQFLVQTQRQAMWIMPRRQEVRIDGSKKQKAVWSGRVEKNITTADCDAYSAKKTLVKRGGIRQGVADSHVVVKGFGHQEKDPTKSNLRMEQY